MIFLVVIFLKFIAIKGCNELFSIYTDNYGPYGVLRLQNVALQPNINVELTLSMAAQLPKVNTF
jgi:hypothetical protein